MKKVVFLLIGFCSNYVYSSCELDAHIEYLNAANASFLEAANLMSKEDPQNYKLVEEFVSLHIEYNNLRMYTAKKLESNGSDLVDKTGTIQKFIKQESQMLPDGTIVSREELQMSKDPHYKKSSESLKYFKSFYLFGFKLEGPEREKWNEFSKAREKFSNYLEKTNSMPAVRAGFSKKLSEVCPL
jgi:hypothetical protein